MRREQKEMAAIGSNGSTTQTSAEISKQEALRRVARAMEQVQYGEIVVKMQGGKPVWVDKYERERVG